MLTAWSLAAYCVAMAAAIGPLARHDGIIINMLGEDFFFCTNPYKARFAEFENLTGAKINYISLGNDKDFLKELKIEIGSEVEEGVGLYDAYAIKGSWTPDLAAGGGIADLKPYIKQRPAEIQWDDIFPAVRDHIMTLDGKVITFPADADYITMAYREDLLVAGGYQAPQTWEDVLALGQHFHGQDLNNDSEPDYGVCMMKLGDITQAYGQVMAVVAPYMQSKGTSQGIFFDPETMEPLVETQGFKDGLKMYKELTRISKADQWHFGKGGCAIFITLPGFLKISSVPPEKYGPKNFDFQPRMSPPPGTTQVYDRRAGRMEQCTAELCPFLASDGVNRVPFWAESGFAFAVSAYSRPAVKQAAADLLIFMQMVSLDLVVEDQGCFDPWRRSHVASDNKTMNKYKSSWHGQTELIESYMRTAKESLESQNTGLDIRIPGFLEYVQVFVDEIEKFEKDEIDVDEATRRISDSWKATVLKHGLSRQRKAYRKSIGLPPLACARGMFLNNSNGDCEPCPRGHFGPAAGLEACEPCLPGTYSNSIGAVTCSLCDKGFAQVESAQSDCQACKVGYVAKDRGMPTCLPCNAGYYVGMPQQQTCEPCAVGTYANTEGMSQCARCKDILSGMTTLLMGASESSQCMCGEDFFEDKDGGACVPCPEGVTCLGFGKGEILKPGFSSESLNVHTLKQGVYQCAIPSDCPGQASPGDATCEGNRVGIACSKCPDGHSFDGEDCAPCGSSGSLVFFFTLPILCIGGLAWYIANYKKGLKVYQMTKTSNVVFLLGLFAQRVQTLGTFGTTTIPWPSQAKSVISICAISLGQGFESINQQFPCATGQGALASYLVTILCFFAIIFSMCFSVFFSVLPQDVVKFDKFVLANCQLAFMKLGFTSLLFTAVQPMICFSHPNGKSSLLKYPNVLCGESEHHKMLAAGIILLSLAIAFIGAVWYLTLLVMKSPPQEGLVNSDLALHRASRFLWFQFRSRTTYWTAFAILRGLFLSVVPVICPDNAFNQVQLMAGILIVYALATGVAQPWHTWVLNALDCSSYGLEILILVGGLPFVAVVDGATLASRGYGDQENWLLAWMALLPALFLLALVVNFALPREKLTLSHARQASAGNSPIEDASEPAKSSIIGEKVLFEEGKVARPSMSEEDDKPKGDYEAAV